MPQQLKADTKDLGGFTVTRILPHPQKKMVGPFIFFDRMGPASFEPGNGVNVRPPPHIGLATISYLFEGSMLHRDSLGTVQEIFPGDLNWMIAGSGIVHSERETVEVRARAHCLDGIQCWIALPEKHEQTDPGFDHVAATDLPCVYQEDLMIRVIVGSAYGTTAPVKTYSPMFYLDVLAGSGSVLERPHADQETAVYVVSGRIRVAEQDFGPEEFVLLDAASDSIQTLEQSRFMLLGGEKFDQPPIISWNFVTHSKDRLAQAMQRWEQGAFPSIPGDDREFIPLPVRKD